MSESGSFEFDSVPIVEVTSDNAKEMEPAIRVAIANSDFVSIDCELSGLGNRKKLNTSSMEERYDNTGLVAKTRSIIALGLSAFRRVNNEATSEVSGLNYHVQTFNIMVLCSEDYIVEPQSLKFLVEHGFDFVKQYSKGLSYYRGDDKDESSLLRQIFSELIIHQKPIVLHNGFIDLVFLYQNLYAQLPVSLESFIADLAEMFPQGIYDTKFLADYVCRTPSSFLEFVFKMLQKRNVMRGKGNQPHIRISFPTYPDDCSYLDRRNCVDSRPDPEDDEDNVEICNSYADHGHCQNGQSCDKSHNIDRIVTQKGGGKKRRKVETSKMTAEESLASSEKLKLERQNGSSECSAGHRAGFDAFMTGFSFITFLTYKNVAKVKAGEDAAKSKFLADLPVHPDLSDNRIANKIYLVCKDIPLLINKSNFAKNSISHAEKIVRLRPE